MIPYQNIWGSGSVGEGTKLAAFVDIGGQVGKNCSIQAFVSIPPGIIIEDEVFVGPGVNFANDKYPSAKNPNFVPQHTVVRKGAKIGMGAQIGPGIEIGENAVIGMGAVVLSNVPPGETWVGVPAKKLER